MKYYRKLIGKRIYLSPMSLEDADTYTRWMNDLRVTDGLGRSSNLVNFESEKKWILENANDYQFAIVRDDNDMVIGNCGIHKIEQRNQSAEIGICIGEESHRNQGYGGEALNLLLDYAFDYLNLNNIMLKAFSFNTAAIRCYEKIGFKEIGRRRKACFVKGEFWDDVYMDILRDEYRASKEK